MKDTVQLMLSENYKDRFVAEYRQTKARYEKLHRMVVKYEAGKLDFTPTCPIELLKEQKAAMGKYLYMLEVRAEMEGVDLGERGNEIEQTNEERIRGLDTDELAWELMNFRVDAVAGADGSKKVLPDSKEEIVKWLKSRAHTDRCSESKSEG